MEATRSSMSFRQGSLWVQLGSTVVLYAVYFAAVWRGAASGPALVSVIAAQTVVTIALSILIAVRARPEAADERDAAISRRAARVAYFVLGMGALLLAVGLIWFPGEWARPATVGNLIVFGGVTAEATRSAAQLVYYRVGP